MLLPDQIHINRIRERLWCGRDIGQASVMIGSGFSRNAVKVYPTAPPFPLWNDLVGELQTRLGSKNSDVIRLGSEYEVVFGRQSLDDLLISLIPDLQYQPDKLHKLLLSLPWSDVFTTNYDTLLERTTSFIYDRKYDTVLTHSDLPGRMKPRIVKLHGSFPSHRPFIFTEEDYRSYPKKFAPFVNTVQQSIMENIFCLIGFSGDDPNFLNWIGWVRDNLGDSTPPIYLCGLLNLSASQKQLLATKNIITIDLSPIFTTAEYPDKNIRHARAIEWFLLNLMQGEPANKLDWPEPPVAKDLKKWEPSIDLPSFPDTKILSSTWENRYPSNSMYDSFEIDDIRNIVENWKRCREAYPDFVICPRVSRNQIWHFTDKWLSLLIHSQSWQNLQETDSIECLSTLYEINWRFEKCLLPLYTQISASVETCLLKINPFPKSIHFDDVRASTIAPESKEKINNWSDVRNQWVTLAFAIIKEARREREQEKFNLWIARIEKIVNLDLDWHSRWLYEQCLFELVSLNRSKLSSLLKDWQSLDFSNMWRVKLSCILFEIGEYLKAEEIARQALTDVRSRLRPYTIDYSLLSQEGIAMMILEAIEQRNDYRKSLEVANGDRWDILSNYKCNPCTELNNVQRICEEEPPQPNPVIEVKQDFDPKYFSTSYRFGCDTTLSLSDLRPGFEFLLMIEEIGIPPLLLKSSIPNMAKWIEHYYPLLGIEILLRCQNEREIKAYFNHIAIEILNQSDIEILYDWLFSRLRESINRLKINAILEEYTEEVWVSFNTSLDILSRILSRISSEKSIQIFKVIVKYISDNRDRQSVQIREAIRSFWRSAFAITSNTEILHRMEILLKIPLSTDRLLDNADCIDPFFHLNWKNNFLLPQGFNRNSWNTEISKLIDNVDHGDDFTRECSLVRILKLIEINALMILEQERLASALWNQLDEETGLPLIGSTYLSKSNLLCFPETTVNRDKTAYLLKKLILSSEITDILRLTLNSSSPHLIRSHCIIKRGIKWTPAELHVLLEKIHQYSSNSIRDSVHQIAQLSDIHPFINDDLQKNISNIIDTIVYLVVPAWINLENNTKELVINVLNDIQTSKYSTNRILPCLLFVRNSGYDNDKLHANLTDKIYSSNAKEIEDATWGICNWIMFCKSGLDIPEPSYELIDILIYLFVSRRQPGFDSYSKLILGLTTCIPDLLDITQLCKLISGVQYILNETSLAKREKRGEYMIPNQKCRSYRGLAYEIAHQLDLIYSIRFPEDRPSIIDRWKEDSLNETWPEIRSLWQQN